MIKAENLIKTYILKSGELHALNGVSLDIADGEFVSIIGKSGSGKTTLLNLLGALDTPTNDCKIEIDGVNIIKLKAIELAKLRREKLSFVFQNFNLEPNYTAYENVEVPLVINGKFGKGNSNSIKEALDIVGLTNKEKVKTKFLSGGEMQRVAIARAIVKQSRYIFADEPCGNLDSENSNNIMKILKDINACGTTIILVTHDIEAANNADRIITIADGKVEKNEKNNLAI